MPRAVPSPPLPTANACANQLVDALAGVLPLERCHELATLREDGNRDQRFTGVEPRKAVQGAKRLWLARDTTGAPSASVSAALVVEATMHRFRPILLTAAAAILGMIPIAPTVFWGPMAYAIMGGLAVATLLTLVFLPALYVAWFRIETPHLEAGPEEASRSSSDDRTPTGVVAHA